jgi:hypothetical protein
MSSTTRRLRAATAWAAAAFVLASGLVAGVPVTGSADPSSPEAVPQTQTATVAGGQLLRFEPNRGRLDPRVRYVARGSDVTVWLTDTEIVLATAAPAGGRSVVRLRLSGDVKGVRPRGEARLPGGTSSFVGNDRRRWRTGLPGFGRVRYPDVAAGVDLVVRSERGSLSYDVVAEPGADVSRLGLDVTGAHARFGADGRLVLEPGTHRSSRVPATPPGRTTGMRVVVGAPRERAAAAAAPVASVRHAPRLAWSTFLGGSGSESVVDLAVNRLGATFVTGFTTSDDFPTRRAVQPAPGSEFDVYVAKFRPGGQRLAWSTYLGGNGDDGVSELAVDRAGRVHVVGGSSSRDWPTRRPLQAEHGGGEYDAVVATLSRGGARLRYSTYLGGSDNDSAFGVALGPRGARALTGTTWSTDFPLRRAVQDQVAGLQDMFVTKLTPAGRRVAWSTLYGGSLIDTGRDIAYDRRGALHVVGWSDSPDVPTVRPIQPRSAGFNDAILLSLPVGGQRIRYATYLGGADNDNAIGGVAIDRRGRVHLAGATFSTDFPVRRALQPESGGESDVYAAVVSRNGQRLVRSTYLGGSDGEGGLGAALDLAVDRIGRVQLVGRTHSPDFPLRRPVQRRLRGEENAFVTVLGPRGRRLHFSTYLGGSGVDGATSVAAGRGRGVYVAGGTTSPDFPVLHPFQARLRGESDGFVSRLVMPRPAARAP